MEHMEHGACSEAGYVAAEGEVKAAVDGWRWRVWAVGGQEKKVSRNRSLHTTAWYSYY
jgi:hypothetical protein